MKTLTLDPRKYPLRMCALALFASWGAGQAMAQSTSAAQAHRDNAALRTFPEVHRAARDVSPIIDRAARNHAESSAQRATGNSASVTSRDRPADSPRASRAHDRGAIDVVTPNMRRDVGPISREAGRGYTTIHETPVTPRPNSGTRPHDRHEIYQNGTRVNTTTNPRRATGEHIHVQPEFNKRLHDAVSPPSTRRTEGTVNVPGRGVR